MLTAHRLKWGLITVFLSCGLFWIWTRSTPTEKLPLIISAVTAAVTIVYAVLTNEILGQNQAMAKAAFDSARIMENGQRFSHSAALVLTTLSTKDPNSFAVLKSIRAVKNSDYKRALDIFGSSDGKAEFVFAILENKGLGSATHVVLDVTYKINDESSVNRQATVTKRESIPVLEPEAGVAVCVFISQLPSANDRVVLSEAKLTFSDLYRDANREAVSCNSIEIDSHFSEQSDLCVIQLT